MINLHLPDETLIYRAKVKPAFVLVASALLFVFGLYSLTKAVLNAENWVQWTISGIFFTLYGGYYMYWKYLELIDKTAQLVISKKGIATITTPLKQWEDIEDEEIIHTGTGNHILVYLVYNFPGGSEKLKVNDFSISYQKMEGLLKAYREENSLTHKKSSKDKSSSSSVNKEDMMRDFFNK